MLYQLHTISHWVTLTWCWAVVGFGRKDVVDHLLDCGADVHARDDGGLIPLHNACSFGHAEVVHLLLSHGADANARDNWNYTPLHEAAIKGKIDVCLGQCLSFTAYPVTLCSLFGQSAELSDRFVVLWTSSDPVVCITLHLFVWNYNSWVYKLLITQEWTQRTGPTENWGM